MFKVLKKHLPSFYLLMLFANTTILANAWLYLFVTILLFGYTLLKGGKIPYAIIVLSVLWISINIVASLFTGLNFEKLYVLRMVFFYFVGPYVFLTIFGLKLIDRLLNLIYYLTLIGLMLFALNYFNISFFDNLKSVFDPLTRDVLREGPRYWSSGLYTNAILTSDGLLRNCGFMWEPGYFALMSVFGIIMHWLKNGASFDKKFLIFSIAIITTFSTAGYLSLFVLIIAKYQRSLSFTGFFITLTFIVLFSIYIYSLPFISGKLELYNEIVESNEFNFSEAYGAIKLNRFQVFLYDLKRLAFNPFGYGSIDSFGLDGVPVVGTNGLSGVYRIWGVFLGTYFFNHVYQFMMKFNFFDNNKRVLIVLYIAFVMMLFSNPVNTNLFFYFIVVTSIIYNKLRL